MSRVLITPEQAIELLPDGEWIHTFNNLAFGLIGADWTRDEVIEELRRCDTIEIAGNNARALGHGLAVYNSSTKLQSEVLFVETDEEKIKAYPLEEAADGNDD